MKKSVFSISFSRRSLAKETILTSISTLISTSTLTSILFLFSLTLFAQQTSIRDFDLKNYKAPDIKYRTLDLGTYLSTSGYSESANDNDNNFNGNVVMDYFEYRNSKKIQSRSNAYFRGSYYSSWSKTDSVKTTSSNPKLLLSYATETRFYNQNNAFFGIHGDIKYEYSPHFSKSEDETYSYQYQEFLITPYISGGKGRIEPIESARQAMDILLAIQKENRLSKIPDNSMIDSLARVANLIRYKRFYDSRFKRIYQLEELDKSMQNMDLVETADMVYFANLNDIWNFAPQFNRGTGIRYEGGVVPTLSTNYYYNEETDSYQARKRDNKDYGIYGFFSFNRMKPVSYAWQSDILIDFTFGYGVSDQIWKNGEDVGEYYNSSLNGLLSAGWEFGFYPNTRTHVGIEPYISFSYDYNLEEKNKDVYGLNTGFRFNSYYYVSPRLRVQLTAGFAYLDNFNYDIPAPFWNRINYYDFNSSQIEKGIIYNFMFSFKYAIF